VKIIWDGSRGGAEQPESGICADERRIFACMISMSDRQTTRLPPKLRGEPRSAA
jgi:hypothetical protein